MDVIEAAGLLGKRYGRKCFSTHVVAELEQVAGYLIVLGRGEVLLSGTTADLTAAHGGQRPEQVILSALRENAEHAQGQAQEVAR